MATKTTKKETKVTKSAAKKGKEPEKVKKAAAKKEPAKKETAKKEAVKKTASTAKVTTKKAAPKAKAETKKAAPKVKAEPKKAASKSKAVTKKASVKPVEANKTATKATKPSVKKKASTAKADAKKTAGKKAAAEKKTPAKKATTAKAAAKTKKENEKAQKVIREALSEEVTAENDTPEIPDLTDDDFSDFEAAESEDDNRRISDPSEILTEENKRRIDNLTVEWRGDPEWYPMPENVDEMVSRMTAQDIEFMYYVLHHFQPASVYEEIAEGKMCEALDLPIPNRDDDLF